MSDSLGDDVTATHLVTTTPQNLILWVKPINIQLVPSSFQTRIQH